MVNHGIPFIRATNLVNGVISTKELLYISEHKHFELKKGHLKAGDVLFTNRGEIGKLGIVPVELDNSNLNSQIAWLRCGEKLLNKYLFYFLASSQMKDLFKQEKTGAALQQLTIRQIENIKVPLPTLSIQKKIVEKIDAIFAEIDKATAATEANIKNAEALFQSYLAEIFMCGGEGWETKTIGDISKIKGGKRVPKGSSLQYEPTPYKYLRVADFGDDGQINQDKLMYASADVREKIKNYTINSEDLYVSIAGTIGKTGIVPKELDGALLTENACKLVFNTDIYNKFVYYFTLTESFKAQALENTRTSAQPKLALSRLQNIQLKIPTVSEQILIAKKFDLLNSKIQSCKLFYEMKLNEYLNLRNALLKQVFEGKLVKE